MRIAEINMTASGSTGRIMLQIAELAKGKNMMVQTFSTRTFARKPEAVRKIENHLYYGSFFENTIHTVLGKITGYNGCFSYFGTRDLVRKLEKMKPDVLHLHNLHQFCIHMPTLFRYIKKNNVRVIWTLHDCWTFTGHCPHFTVAQCNKWKTRCYACSQYKKYPKTYVDQSKNMYAKKKKWFLGVKDMTLVTPSEWLANLVGQSFLKDYPVKVIHNGIDLSIFKPTVSDFRERYHCEQKKILLGVSFGWGYSKGLDVFVELAKRLDDSYQIVLVGTNEGTSQMLPKNVISIHRTENQEQLAEIYTAADLFINPTREDTYPTVNMEALACGTPVLTFNTGGSPEIISNACGSVVACDDMDALEKEVKRICEDKPYSEESCLERASRFDMNEKYEEYTLLYENSTYST